MTKKLRQCHGAVIPMEKSEFDNSGRFEGYATVYGVPIERLFGSVVMDPGLFSESIKEKGAGGIRMLWQHDTDQPIGVYESITEDSKGIRVVGRLLADDIARARETYALMKNKAIGGLSVGFGVEESKKNDKDGLEHYTKGDLWEISAVTFPANSQAKIDRVHSLTENFESIREFEAFLREAGLSKKTATAVALHGFRGLQRREADEEQEAVEIIQKIKKLFKGEQHA